MITLRIPDREELYDVTTNTFLPPIKGGVYQFEHSLRSLTEWEEKYKVPFLHTTMTPEQSIDYACMMCTTGIDPLLISNEVLSVIIGYLSYEPTATTINDAGDSGQRRIITAEVIYAWMANANVPFECDTWNLKKLLVLLRVISSQNSTPKKQSYEDRIAMQARLNEERKAKLGIKD